MPIRQVKDILDHICGYHRALVEQLQNLSCLETDRRLKLLVEYMSRHEQNFERALAEYKQDMQQEILNTWLQNGPEQSIEAALQNLKLRDDMTTEEILSVVLSFDRTLTDLYRELADETPIPRVQQIFSNLLELEDGTDRQFATAVQGMSDV